MELGTTGLNFEKDESSLGMELREEHLLGMCKVLGRVQQHREKVRSEESQRQAGGARCDGRLPGGLSAEGRVW